MKQKGAGFTILEVVIFLAITGLLLLVAFIGTGTMSRRTQFSDSVNRLQSFVQRQYEEMVSGVNDRSVTACGSIDPGTGGDNCLLLGKEIVFVDNSSTVTTFDIISTEPVSDMSGRSLAQIYEALLPIKQNPQTYPIEWGAVFHNPSGANRPRAIAFMRSPISSSIKTYIFDDTTAVDNSTSMRSALKNDPVNKAYFCIADDATATAVVAAVQLTGGDGIGTIMTNYQPGKECT